MCIVLYVALVCLFHIDVVVHWCTGLVGCCVGVRSLCRSNSKTALNTWCACLMRLFACDFYDSVWSAFVGAKEVFVCEHCTTGNFCQQNFSTLTVAPLTCALTCKDVTRGNHRYLQVYVCVCVRVYSKMWVGVAVLRPTGRG